MWRRRKRLQSPLDFSVSVCVGIVFLGDPGEFLAVDILDNYSQIGDVADDVQWSLTMSRIGAKGFSCLFAAPPCRSFPKAQSVGGGPPVLRTREIPEGFLAGCDAIQLPFEDVDTPDSASPTTRKCLVSRSAGPFQQRPMQTQACSNSSYDGFGAGKGLQTSKLVQYRLTCT